MHGENLGGVRILEPIGGGSLAGGGPDLTMMMTMAGAGVCAGAVRGRTSDVGTSRRARVARRGVRSVARCAVANEVDDFCLSTPAKESVLGVILGGGAGSRLYPLTKKRAKPAVPLGANYRLIDIPVSNCINSDINKIYVLTQFNSASLNRHLSRAYSQNMGSMRNEGFVEVLAAQQSPNNPNWFQGTADAIRQYLWLIKDIDVQDILILAGDHLYRQDYSQFIFQHRQSNADITVSALPCNEADASSFGLMKIDGKGKILEFAEKPSGEALQAMRADDQTLRTMGMSKEDAKETPFLASMGIYVFKREALVELLESRFPDADDFGGEVIPQAKESGYNVQSFLFQGYWADIGTIRAFYEANLSLTIQPNPPFSFYDKDASIYTQARYLPPSKVQSCKVSQAIIGDGCVIKDCVVHHSVIGLRSVIDSGCEIRDALVMGADMYDRDATPSSVPLGIGKNCTIKNAIIDKNARIGPDCSITNKDGIEEDMTTESKGYIIRGGIVVVLKDATIPAGTVI